MSQPARQLFSFPEYVLLEEMSTVKHEYLEGEVWAMAGGTPEHSAIAANIIRLLGERLRGQRCRVFTSDLRIRVRETGLGTYPDASVVCDQVELDPEDQKGHTAVNPRLLVEVLSPSTHDYDTGEKLEHYKRIPSLREFLLISHDRRQATLWARHDGSKWSRRVFGEGESVEVPSLGCELPVEEIYFDPLSR